MGKWLIGAGIAVAAVALVVGGAAFAASTVADAQAALAVAQAAVPFPGRGGVGMEPGGPGPFGQSGRLHDYMLGALADALSLSAEELEAGLAEGQQLAEIAAAQGIVKEDLAALLVQARADALQAAVDDGVLTQEQADWMADHPVVLRMLAGMRGGRGDHGPRGQMGR